MTTTIALITAHMATPRNEPGSANAKRLTASWQNGLEAGNQVQRKLHLAFTNAANDKSTQCLSRTT